MPSFFPGPVSIPSALGWLFSLALYGNSSICFGFEEPSLQRDGCAAFEVSEAKSYEVHVLKGPEGYVYASDEVFHTDKKASDLTIVLKKAD